MDKIERFTNFIKQESLLLDQFIEQGRVKRTLIILNRVEELDKLIQKESVLVNSFRNLEAGRFQLQQELGGEWQAKGDELTAQALIAHIRIDDASAADELQSATDDLETRLHTLAAINDENNGLLNLALSYVNEIQAIINGDVAGTYSETGRWADETTSRPQRRILDTKA